MLEIPVIRWGQPYESMDKEPVVHFETGEELATVHQANGGLIKMDMRKANKARDILRQFSIEDLCGMAVKAADLYMEGTLPLGDGTQNPQEFCRMQSATTGLPEHMCAGNMRKNAYVLKHMKDTLQALTRRLPFDILTNGYGKEPGSDVMMSYQANTNVVGMVLPSNSPGVHTLWMPVIPLQIGLVLKPGPQEPWTPYRMYEAFAQAGIPREVMSIYPGGPELRRSRPGDLQSSDDLRRHGHRRTLPRRPARAGPRSRLLQDPPRRRRRRRLGEVPRSDGRQRSTSTAAGVASPAAASGPRVTPKRSPTPSPSGSARLSRSR